MIPVSTAAAPEWYGTVYGIAFAVARRKFRMTSADAEDVAQEMTLRALRQTASGGINRAWVHRGATYLCIDLTRSRAAEQRALESYLHEMTMRAAARHELDRDLVLALGQLAPSCQFLIHHYFREGRTWREIDTLLARGRRCSQYATRKCLESLQQLVARPRQRGSA